MQEVYHRDVDGELVGRMEELVVGIGGVCRNVSIVAELTPVLAHDQSSMITPLHSCPMMGRPKK